MGSDKGDTKKGNILVVDDTPANLRLLSNMLSEDGYHVRPVPDGKLALAAVQAEQPDIILLDVRMPGMSGYDVCEQLKSETKTLDIPIIFISALDAIQDKVRAFEAGGVDYITKPFHVEEVLARVDTHLSLRRLQKELQEANKKMERELILAGEVQTSFLPQTLPQIPGWQFSTTLKPARETSGDFYDVNVIHDGYLNFLVADVVDKGAGAALFMALSYTLFRTYAAQYPFDPNLVLSAVNRRILETTGGQQFVSVFYGVLELDSGDMSYCNAGHPPPIFISSIAGGKARKLVKTGITLGISEVDSWQKETVKFTAGDTLLLYTDGITDASDKRGEFFGESAIVDSLKKNTGQAVKDIQAALLADVGEFVGDAPQQDDIALVILARDG